ncbi:MAG: deoxyribose-phosphate aldolase [Lachnospiraceae bacterium]|jgi:deoxyribose-phosphate aldolase|nr:deoxyribose-phosphate aldolase [Lachnospiraceae bacterium]
MDTELKEILAKVDHTLLSVDSTWDEIKVICDDALTYQTASVCIPAAYVKRASEYIKEEANERKVEPVKVCTVIGFPNGYSTTAVKCFEAEEAIMNGADEIDMVIHVGALKDKKYDDVLKDIKSVKTVCGDRVLKVIIETCLLTDEEKIKMCEIVNESGADYIKTSTGFSKGGATLHDVEIFAKYIKAPVKIKAAGGISSIEDAKAFVAAGADRLGTSRIVKIVKSNQ